MARVMALDYGKKRSGLATTDSLQLIASPLTTVETPKLMEFFEDYLKTEKVECLVIGQPTHADGTATPLEEDIQQFIEKFVKKFPAIKLERQDERFTSQMASEVIRFSVKKKKKRREKGLVDQISAAIILQEYMGFI
jgi:putative Holliday junction resolvase